MRNPVCSCSSPPAGVSPVQVAGWRLGLKRAWVEAERLEGPLNHSTFAVMRRRLPRRVGVR